MALCLPETDESIARAAALVRAGEVIVFPTDTLYGLGADATSEAAVARVIAIKGRSEAKPLLVLVRDLAEARICGRIEGAALALAERFWPGPLTLVVERNAASPLAHGLNPLGRTIGLRVPGRAATLALLRAVGRPLTAPSANLSGAPPALDAAAANTALGAKVALVLDGGTSAAVPSTIVEWREGELRMLREGAIARCSVEAVARVVDE